MEVEAWIPRYQWSLDGAWRAGEVAWGNGHWYIMRWFDDGPDSGRVERRHVRPLPDPTVKLPADLAAGDLVDVLHRNLWERAEVVRVAGQGQFEVKIVGSPEVLAADPSVLRPWMLYGEKNGWVVHHKGKEIPLARYLRNQQQKTSNKSNDEDSSSKSDPSSSDGDSSISSNGGGRAVQFPPPASIAKKTKKLGRRPPARKRSKIPTRGPRPVPARQCATARRRTRKRW